MRGRMSELTERIPGMKERKNRQGHHAYLHTLFTSHTKRGNEPYKHHRTKLQRPNTAISLHDKARRRQ